MSTFVNIISKFYPDIDINMPAFTYKNTNSSKLMNRNYISYAFINTLHRGLEKKKFSKFKILHSSIVSNYFISRDIKKQHELSFSKAQRRYYALCRIARIYKTKHALHYDMNTDLCMRPLSKIKSSIKLDPKSSESINSIHKIQLINST